MAAAVAGLPTPALAAPAVSGAGRHKTGPEAAAAAHAPSDAAAGKGPVSQQISKQPAPAAQPKAKKGPKRPLVLYIQTEYCQKTLRDAMQEEVCLHLCTLR